MDRKNSIQHTRGSGADAPGVQRCGGYRSAAALVELIPTTRPVEHGALAFADPDGWHVVLMPTPIALTG